MTYPPHQPGPGGWGQPAAGNPPEGSPPPVPPGVPQHQPAFYGNQHAGWPQGPITGVPVQQPAPQPAAPGWGGEPGAWPSESDGFADDEPPDRRSPLFWLLSGPGVLVAAGAAVGGFLLFGGSDPGSPQPVAEDVVDRVNAGDFRSLGPALCQANRPELDRQLGQLSSGRFQIRLGQVSERDEQARAALTGTYSLGGATMPVDQAMLLRVEDGRWKVCELGG